MSGRDFNYYKRHSVLDKDFIRLFESTPSEYYTDAFYAECLLLLEICMRKLLAHYKVKVGNKHNPHHYTILCSQRDESIRRALSSLEEDAVWSINNSNFNALRFSGHKVKPDMYSMKVLCKVALARISVLEVLGN